MTAKRYTTQEQIEAMHEAISQAKLEREQRLTKRHLRVERTKRSKVMSRALGWIAFLIIIILLLTTLRSINTVKSKGGIPELLGFQLYVIESGSMEPTLPTGTIILSRKPEDASKLRVKDIVTFRAEADAVVTHRIIEVLTDAEGRVSYRTKGDNPVSSPDQDLLDPDRVIAVFLLKIPFT